MGVVVGMTSLRSRMTGISILCSLAFLLSELVQAELRIASIISEGMVLQQEEPFSTVRVFRFPSSRFAGF